MTLDKHEIQGVQRIGSKVLPISTFEELVIEAGYYKTAPSFGTRVKVWFSHNSYGRLDCIYGIRDTELREDLSNSKSVTAYHKFHQTLVPQALANLNKIIFIFTINEFSNF